MAGTARIELRCRFAWWLFPYLHLLAFFCGLHQAEPRWDRLWRLMLRGIVVEASIGGRWRRVF